MCELPATSRKRLADVTGTGDPPPDLHSAFGVTDEIGTCASYERPQQWAQAWWENGFAGVRYRLRRGNGRLGSAMFRRPHGLDVSAPEPLVTFRVTEDRLAEWRDGEMSIRGEPSSRDLTIHDAVVDDLHT